MKLNWRPPGTVENKSVLNNDTQPIFDINNDMSWEKGKKKDFIQKFSTLMILRGEVKFFGQSQFYGSIHFHVKLIKVKFFQTCRY